MSVCGCMYVCMYVCIYVIKANKHMFFQETTVCFSTHRGCGFGCLKGILVSIVVFYVVFMSLLYSSCYSFQKIKRTVYVC